MFFEDDEIALIAKVTMTLGAGCQETIDTNIANASDAGQWAEVNKWHRVRLRIDRLQRQMTRTRPAEFKAALPLPYITRYEFAAS